MIELVVFDIAGTTDDKDNVVYTTAREATNTEGSGFVQEEVT